MSYSYMYHLIYSKQCCDVGITIVSSLHKESEGKEKWENLLKLSCLVISVVCIQVCSLPGNLVSGGPCS